MQVPGPVGVQVEGLLCKCEVLCGEMRSRRLAAGEFNPKAKSKAQLSSLCLTLFQHRDGCVSVRSECRKDEGASPTPSL